MESTNGPIKKRHRKKGHREKGHCTKGQILEIKTNNSRDNDYVYLESIRKEIENVDFLKSMMKYYCTLDITGFDINKLPK